MKPVMKDEFKVQDIDALQCLDGFNIVLAKTLTSSMSVRT